MVQPRVITTSRRGRGGALSGQRVLRFLGNLLGAPRHALVTTFFDLYGLPADFPGTPPRVAASTDGVVRAQAIEAGFHETVVRRTGCRPERFVPHLQPNEFEALLFSDTAAFATVEPTWEAFLGQFGRIRASARTPEHIDDGPATHPSALLTQLRNPRYRKVRHGSAIARQIGLDRIRAECHHFDQWLGRLESLGVAAARG